MTVIITYRNIVIKEIFNQGLMILDVLSFSLKLVVATTLANFENFSGANISIHTLKAFKTTN